MKPILLTIACTLSMCIGVAHAQQGNPTKAKERVELQCGTHTVTISCGKARPNDENDERVCVHNALNFIDKFGNVFIPNQPKSFHDPFVIEKTPTGISCEFGKDGKYYVIVEFVAGPLACSPCTTIEIFSESGERLTINGATRRGVNINFDRILSYTAKSLYIEEYGK